MFKSDDRVRLKRDIYRNQVLYAKQGGEGTIVKMFKPVDNERSNLRVRVQMDNGQLQNFRMSSLEKIQ